MDFVAIDFETASNNPNSACQLGLVIVRQGRVHQELDWLIRPPRLYFSPRNTAIHGIRPKQVADAPSMEELWSNLSQVLDGQVIIAHNAKFDINVLVQSLAAFDIACPQLEFNCTRTLARAAWPGRSRYGLKPLGTSIGIRFRHHDALEDARCCARIALAIATEFTESEGEPMAEQEHASQAPMVSLERLESKLQVKRGYFCDGRISGPVALGRKNQGRRSQASADRWGFPARSSSRIAGVDADAVVRASADAAPLANKKIVLLGPLRGLSWEATLQLINQLGGTCQSAISPETDFVVACGSTLDSAKRRVGQELSRPPADMLDEKQAPNSPGATSRPASQPLGIRVLSERQFRALLPGGRATQW